MNARDLGIVTLKLGFSGALIFAIAAVFLVVSDDGEISEAQADLYDLQPLSIHKHGDFERVIKDSGLEPRPYDFNGNHVNFAVGESGLTPEQLLEHYQTRFERAGINSRVYEESMFGLMGSDKPDATDELAETTSGFLSGEMVPLSITEDHVAMAGLLNAVDPDSPEFDEFREQLESQSNEIHDPAQLAQYIHNLSERHLPPSSQIGGEIYEDSIDGFRYLEAHREPGSSYTTVVSSWSDGDFDANKISDPDAHGVGADAEVPACIGCQRDNRLEALSDDEPFVLNQFRSPFSTPDEITSFYDRAMTNRQWERVDVDQGLSDLVPHIPELQQMPGEMANFRRGDEHLTVFIPDRHGPDGELNVVTMREEATD